MLWSICQNDHLEQYSNGYNYKLTIHYENLTYIKRMLRLRFHLYKQVRGFHADLLEKMQLKWSLNIIFLVILSCLSSKRIDSVFLTYEFELYVVRFTKSSEREFTFISPSVFGTDALENL